MPRVGYIRAGTPRNDPFREEFVRGMRDLGYVEGRNIAYGFRHYGDDVESIPSLIGHLLRAKVDIIVVGGTAAIRAAQSATQSIPIVMGAAADPLGTGLVPGLAHPDRRAVRLHHRILQVRGLEDFEPSFASIRAWPADAIFVLDDATFIASRAAMAAASSTKSSKGQNQPTCRCSRGPSSSSWST